MSADHAHALPGTQNEKALWWSLGLTGSFLIAEIVAGLILNSLALLADAAHMFTDAAALAIALAAIRIARRPADGRRTFGYHRFEILAATFNALLLFGVAIYILVERTSGSATLPKCKQWACYGWRPTGSSST